MISVLGVAVVGLRIIAGGRVGAYGKLVMLVWNCGVASVGSSVSDTGAAAHMLGFDREGILTSKVMLREMRSDFEDSKTLLLAVTFSFLGSITSVIVLGSVLAEWADG
jgi:hypothetical protein